MCITAVPITKLFARVYHCSTYYKAVRCSRGSTVRVVELCSYSKNRKVVFWRNFGNNFSHSRERSRNMVRARPQPHTWANGCARASPRVERHQLSSGCSVRVRAPAFGVRHWLARTHQVCLVPMKGRSLVMCYKCLCACVFGAVEARSSRTSVGSFTSFPARGPPSTSLTAPPLLATRFAPASRPLRSCVCSVPSVGGELHR